MSNLRDLATFLYRTGEGKNLIRALDSLLEESKNQGKDVFEELGLLAGDVSAAEKPMFEKNAS